MYAIAYHNRHNLLIQTTYDELKIGVTRHRDMILFKRTTTTYFSCCADHAQTIFA